MADLDVQTPTRTGSDFVFDTVATLGDAFVNTGREAIIIVNESEVPCDVTIQTPILVDGDLTVAERVVNVGDAETKFIGPFPKSIYNNSSDKVTLTYEHDNLLIAVVRIPL